MTDLSTSTVVGGAVALDPTGLVLDGREEALLCASLFYFRLPRETWEARLAAVRATGYRAIDVYLPWNFHETAPGVWDFEGRRDVGAFLDLAHEAGLAVIARPGPYICSEWDGGALPAWLGLDPDLRVRQAEPRF
ncbi:MAG: beta-galactosidase, partial [Glycomyces artemisiae]|nr:beta-galactosidase [Glycomyces artemisiae]